jgi:hypothetical protein
MSAKIFKKKLSTNLLILAVTILVCLVIAEIFLRFTWKSYRPTGQGMRGNIYDDTLGWVGESNIHETCREGGIEFVVEHNCWGFRDDEVPSMRQLEGKKKVLFIGDSFTYGNGIEKQSRASEILEATDSSYVSFNFGMFGYSTDQELLTLQKFGPVIEPDIVVLFFCGNDLIYNDSDLGHEAPKPHFAVDTSGSLVLGNVPVPRMPESHPVAQWVNRHFALAQIIAVIKVRHEIKEELNKQRTKFRKQPGRVVNRSQTKSGAARELTYYLLKSIRDECCCWDAQFIFCSGPSHKRAAEKGTDAPPSIQMVFKWCSELGINAINLYPVFHEDYIEHGQSLYIWDKMHWNERGNWLAAREILKLINAQETSDQSAL